jgi:TolA protein
MKLYSGKRIGQSGSELRRAIVFSFFLHVIVALAAVFLYIAAVPKLYMPPFYQVKLVGQPADLSQPPLKEEPAPEKPKAEEKAKKAAPKAKRAASKKGALPELSRQKQKPASEEEKREEALGEQPRTGKTESVAVTTPQQEFKFGWYLALVRDKIGQNWRPPPDARDAKARVIFTINRSGMVLDVNLDAEHSSGTFGFQQAAIRAIRSSNPFPQLPDDFPKQTLELSVDLMAE